MRLVRIIERLLAAIPVVLGVLVIVFFFMRLLPGDPVEIMLGDSAASRAEVESLRGELHLDKPLYQQLWLFVSGVVRGDLEIPWTNANRWRLCSRKRCLPPLS